MPDETLTRGTSGVSRCAIVCLRIAVFWARVGLVMTLRWYFEVGDFERCRLLPPGWNEELEVFVTLCGRMGRGRATVASSGEAGMETTDDLRRRIVIAVAAELAEDLLRVKDGMRGKGRRGVDGVVGVSTGDCGCSCILMKCVRLRLSGIGDGRSRSGWLYPWAQAHADTSSEVCAFASSFETM